MIGLFEKNRLSIKYITNKCWSDYIGGTLTGSYDDFFILNLNLYIILIIKNTF